MEQAASQQFDAVVRPMADQMLRSIWRITRNAADAEDALQEALVSIWRRRERIERHPSPRALILRICVHCACDVLRVRLRRSSREAPLVDSDLPAAETADCERQLYNRELHGAIAQALTRLPSRQATAVVMRHVLDLPYDEIAAALGCSEPTARVHVNRACKRLRGLLSSSYSLEGGQ